VTSQVNKVAPSASNMGLYSSNQSNFTVLTV
jgi:hypothetical protein